MLILRDTSPPPKKNKTKQKQKKKKKKDRINSSNPLINGGNLNRSVPQKKDDGIENKEDRVTNCLKTPYHMYFELVE